MKEIPVMMMIIRYCANLMSVFFSSIIMSEYFVPSEFCPRSKEFLQHGDITYCTMRFLRISQNPTMGSLLLDCPSGPKPNHQMERSSKLPKMNPLRQTSSHQPDVEDLPLFNILTLQNFQKRICRRGTAKGESSNC